MSLFRYLLIIFPVLLRVSFAQEWDSRIASELAGYPDLYEASIEDLQIGLDAGRFTSVDLVKAYLARIDEVNIKGPGLRAVLEINPSALQQAAILDHERSDTKKGKRSLLHGIPILLKDNIATVASEGMNTTAGSFSLVGSIVPDDAGVVKRLRKAGAIILGKTSMSEWAFFRGDLPSGWSARSGQGTNAYYPGADPCGSSSGSGIAASIGLATVTLGTETDGSITCPSGNNNIVGIKPTVGLTSRAGVIPITIHQDTVGPMTRTVKDAAIVLSLIAGQDPNDNHTLSQPFPIPDYTKALRTDSLKGKRIGVPRHAYLTDTDVEDSIMVEFEKALEVLRGLGAVVVDPADMPSAEELVLGELGYESLVSSIDFKVQINQWFESLSYNPSGVRSLADLIKFNNDNPTLEKLPPYEDQSGLIRSEETQGFNETYFEALAHLKDLGATRGIDAALQQYQLDALVLPARGHTSTPAAIVGYPIVTVPLGFFPSTTPPSQSPPHLTYPAPNLPFGLSFFSTAFSEFDLISFAYAYEQATLTRLKQEAYTEAIPKTQLQDIVASPERLVHQLAFDGLDYVPYDEEGVWQRVFMEAEGGSRFGGEAETAL